jgi:hypothetical protein
MSREPVLRRRPLLTLVQRKESLVVVQGRDPPTPGRAIVLKEKGKERNKKGQLTIRIQAQATDETPHKI